MVCLVFIGYFRKILYCYFQHLHVVHVKIHQSLFLLDEQFLHFFSTVLVSSLELRQSGFPDLFLHHLRNPEVQKHILTVTHTEHHIGRLDVRVDDVELVHREQVFLQVCFSSLSPDWLADLHFELHAVLEQDEVEPFGPEQFGTDFDGRQHVCNEELLNAVAEEPCVGQIEPEALDGEVLVFVRSCEDLPESTQTQQTVGVSETLGELVEDSVPLLYGPSWQRISTTSKFFIWLMILMWKGTSVCF